MSKFLSCTLLYCFTVLTCFSQVNTNYKTRKLKSGEFLSSTSFYSGKKNEVSFVLVVSSKDLSTWQAYVNEELFNNIKSSCGTKLNLLNYEMTTSPLKDPSFDGNKLDGEYYLVITSNDFDINEIVGTKSSQPDIVLKLFSQTSTTITYLLKAPGVCLNPTGAFGGKIKELVSNYNDKYCNPNKHSENSTTSSSTVAKKSRYLTFDFQYNFGQGLSYSASNTSQKYITNGSSRQGFGVGLDYSSLLPIPSVNENITHELGGGFHFFSNTCLLRVDSAYFSYSDIDKDGETYQRRIYAKNIKEESSINFIEIPVSYTFNYSFAESKAKFYLKGGLRFMYLFSANSTAKDGEFTYRGKYNGIKNELENIEAYNFLESQSVNTNTQNLDINKFNCYAFIGTGVKLKVDARTEFTVGMNVNVAGTNLLKHTPENYITSETTQDYKSLVYSFDKFKINPFSFEFGLISKF